MSAQTKRARPMRADAVRNRRLLLDAARAAFDKHGVNASLDDVARSASVGIGTLYRHFPSRDDLILSVIDDGFLEIRELGLELLEDPDPLRALQDWLDAYARQGSVFDGLARTLVTLATTAQAAQSACHLAREAGAALISRAATHGMIRPDVDVQDVLDMAAAIAWLGERPDRDADQRRRLMRLLIEGLCTRAD